MCGIAAIVNKSDHAPDEKDVQSMLTVMDYRGPDDRGMFVKGNAALGHCRLSIIDTSAAGHQPMHYRHFSIVFNGEIYNYLELKDRLTQCGHRFVSHTDTEVVLHAYEEWRENCLQYLDGMWAFVILDQQNRSLFCARDRFGIKPFYYYSDAQRILFASEIKAILAAGVVPISDRKTLLAYLVLGFSDHGDKTFYREILQLLPGHYAKVDLNTGAMGFSKYYDLSKAVKTEMNASEYSKILKESVRLHLRSDVPVGTCLSGGLDSSVIAALASGMQRDQGIQSRFVAVTAKSQLADRDESGFAKQVVDKCRLDWHLAMPVYEDFLAHIEECLRIQDEPVGGPSVFMQYFVMKKAREAGVKVMLDGQGGDETLLGYERYYPAYFWYLLRRGKIFKLIKEYLLASAHSGLSLFRLAGYIGYFLILPLRKKVLSRRVPFLKPDCIHEAIEMLQHSAKSFLDIESLQHSELAQYQLPHLLHYEDRNSMAHSIEARVPYLSHCCVEAALSLPPTDKINKGYTKYSLRQLAEKILPVSIAWRRNKFGFEAPNELWLKKHLPVMKNQVSASMLLKSICSRIPDLQELSLDMQWKLYNIAVWESQYSVAL